jgi:hypothetical protein
MPVSQILFSKTAPALYVAGGGGSVAALQLERAGCSMELLETAGVPDNPDVDMLVKQAKRLEACVQANTSKVLGKP